MSKAFTEVFGDTPQVRLLDFLADNLEFDYTISQLAEFAGLSRPTVYGLLDGLMEEGLIVHTRTVGRSRFYRIDRNSPVVRSLLRLEFGRATKAAAKAHAEWERSKAQAAPKRRAPRGRAASSI